MPPSGGIFWSWEGLLRCVAHPLAPLPPGGGILFAAPGKASFRASAGGLVLAA
ncbi:hypothetical protein DGo_CA0441 [Deinococcus gobiensis I-0]|uniref:Uncharacterized protein n=1 Tax=Deinococcus gobiensis (strain DSM 21396 / JCM 16679 / CGMCC 1.7299 / I-0) TaxID=745776 RepID=H8GVJ1_DEIGI|nr:hypothetical protein DGo_CA0441 [Deinococcus gobiensis I-0]